MKFERLPPSRPAPVDARVDLAALTRRLERELSPQSLQDYVPGKTALRDTAARVVDCSVMRAERLVLELERLGYVRYDGDPQAVTRKRGQWRFAALARPAE